MYIEDQNTELKVELTKDIKKKLLHLIKIISFILYKSLISNPSLSL